MGSKVGELAIQFAMFGSTIIYTHSSKYLGTIIYPRYDM